MPDIYSELRKLVAQNAGLDEFAALIKFDSMLSHRVIRLANNPFFGFGRKATNLREALFIIGLVQLHDILLCTLIMRAFHPVPSQVFNFKAFWTHSIQCGILAIKIAKLMQLPARSRFFTSGIKFFSFRADNRKRCLSLSFVTGHFPVVSRLCSCTEISVALRLFCRNSRLCLEFI